jgi:hypothetical protein
MFQCLGLASCLMLQIPPHRFLEHVMSSAFKANLTEEQLFLGAPQHIKQSVMLPHDIMESMFLFGNSEVFYHIFCGVPGDLERYWESNSDLADSLGLCPDDA